MERQGSFPDKPVFFSVKRYMALCLALAMHCNICTTARDNLRIADVRTLGMGGSGVAHTPLFNPALLAWQEQRELHADCYSRYSIRELATVSGGFTFPNPILPAGLHVASFGYDEYRESLFRLSAGRRLNRAWALGVSIQYALLQSELFETDVSRLAADIGVAFHPAEDWSVTLSVLNFPSVPLNSERTVSSERIATFLAAAAAGWQITDNLLLTGETAYGRETALDASLGMEYVPFTDFRLRAGMRTSPFRPSLGAGYGFAGIRMDVAMIYHPVLGASIGIGLAHAF